MEYKSLIVWLEEKIDTEDHKEKKEHAKFYEDLTRFKEKVKNALLYFDKL